MPRPEDFPQLLKELIQIGIALTSERDPAVLLKMILLEARRFTRAEAGTLFLREGDQLRPAVVQNDLLAARLGEPELDRLQAEPLPLSEASLAGYVALTGETLNLPDASALPPDRPYALTPALDARSVLVVPFQDPSGLILGVLELHNARDEHLHVVPFDPEYGALVRSLASQAAVALRNTQLEALSFTDSLTGLYNRRHFLLRLDEEAKRHRRFGQPVSLALLDLDHLKALNDQLGHAAGDETLQEVAQLLLAHSRDFTLITRYGGDEFAILLVETPKAGALAYAQRLKALIEQHPFKHGALTVSVGVAGLPEDVLAGSDLLPAADKALYEAKRLGRNRVETTG